MMRLTDMKSGLVKFTNTKFGSAFVSALSTALIATALAKCSTDIGQYGLIKLGANTTRLEGTTWYYHRLWPTGYWRTISDNIIHQIHYRVLNHIKHEAESAK